MILLAGCIIRNQAGEILLLHRNTPGRKQWEIPGGKLERDETAPEAAKREVYEELGIEVDIANLLGSDEFSEDGNTFSYSWFSAVVGSSQPKIMEPETFDELRYFSEAGLYANTTLLSINTQNFIAKLSP